MTEASSFRPKDSELRAVADTYGGAVDLGMRARFVGAWFDADAATAGGPTLTNESVAAMLAETRATARLGSDATAEEIAAAALVYRVSPASITQARNAYRVIMASGARDAGKRTAEMQSAAEALAAGGNAKEMIARGVTIAAMPEAARAEALAEFVDAAAREARERKASAARERKASQESRAALPADAKADDRATNALAALWEARDRVTRALSVADLSADGATMAREEIARFRGALDALDALASMTPTARRKAFGKAPAVKSPAEAPAEAPADAPTPKPRAARKPRAAVAA